jgi:4-aminobutyrate aminotransferase-like enzyme
VTSRTAGEPAANTGRKWRFFVRFLATSSGNRFTQEQAEYAVANSGADWNEQAVKAAKGYMDSGMGFSRQSLIDQLKSPYSNQFTQEQAQHAVDQVTL